VPLPSLDASEAECIADLTLRKRVRRKYPGACSLEFQSAMQIALECLFGWDPVRQKGKRGIFGKMEAYCRADEEHVWIKNFGHLRRLMFAEDYQTWRGQVTLLTSTKSCRQPSVILKRKSLVSVLVELEKKRLTTSLKAAQMKTSERLGMKQAAKKLEGR
jgi:hypothetical protein